MDVQKSGSVPKEVWAAGEAYEPYVGRWSRLVASQFLKWLAVPPGSLWLEVGCGTGALTQTVLEGAAPHAVKGIDSAEGFIAYARVQVSDQRASFQVGDAQALPVENEAYDAVISGLLLNFIPNPSQALAEMARATKPGGSVAAYVWDYASKMQFMRLFWNAVSEIHPEDAHHDEGRRFPLCNAGPLRELFKRAGLSQVVVEPIDIWTEFKDFDDFWSPFLGGQGPAPGYVMGLPEGERMALRERLRAALPFALDGSIPLVARAWAVRGQR